VHGDEVITDGVRIIETPGHTPGHQSLVVESPDGRVIIAGQCTYTTTECTERRVAVDNMHDEGFISAGQQSLDRLLSISPRCVVMAHDPRPWIASAAP